MLNEMLYDDNDDATVNENELTGMEISATAEFGSQTAPQLCDAATQTECYTREVTTSTLTFRSRTMKDKSNQARPPKKNNSFRKNLSVQFPTPKKVTR